MVNGERERGCKDIRAKGAKVERICMRVFCRCCDSDPINGPLYAETGFRTAAKIPQPLTLTHTHVPVFKRRGRKWESLVSFPSAVAFLSRPGGPTMRWEKHFTICLSPPICLTKRGRVFTHSACVRSVKLRGWHFPYHQLLFPLILN